MNNVSFINLGTYLIWFSLFPFDSSAADVYKCVGDDGKVTYSNFQCSSTAKKLYLVPNDFGGRQSRNLAIQPAPNIYIPPNSNPGYVMQPGQTILENEQIQQPNRLNFPPIGGPLIRPGTESMAGQPPAWKNCVPGSIGPGGCDSIGPGGGQSIGPGGGLSIGPGGGLSIGPGGGQSIGPGGGLSIAPGGGLAIDRNKSLGLDPYTLRPYTQ